MSIKPQGISLRTLLKNGRIKSTDSDPLRDIDREAILQTGHRVVLYPRNVTLELDVGAATFYPSRALDSVVVHGAPIRGLDSGYVGFRLSDATGISVDYRLEFSLGGGEDRPVRKVRVDFE